MIHNNAIIILFCIDLYVIYIIFIRTQVQLVLIHYDIITLCIQYVHKKFKISESSSLSLISRKSNIAPVL